MHSVRKAEQMENNSREKSGTKAGFEFTEMIECWNLRWHYTKGRFKDGCQPPADISVAIAEVCHWSNKNPESKMTSLYHTLQPIPLSTAENVSHHWMECTVCETDRQNTQMQNTWNISKPAMSRMPINEAPWRLLRSRERLTRWTIHLNMRSYMDLLIASTAYSTWCRTHASVNCY